MRQESRYRVALADSRSRQNDDHADCLDAMGGAGLGLKRNLGPPQVSLDQRLTKKGSLGSPPR